MLKNPHANAGVMGSIPGVGRSLGEENGNPFQHSYLGNPMERRAWGPYSMDHKESDRTLAMLSCLHKWLVVERVTEPLIRHFH